MYKRETFCVNARTSFSSSAFLSCLLVSRTAVSCLSKYRAVDWRLPTLVSVNCNHIRLYLELSVLRCWPSPKRPGSGPLVPKASKSHPASLTTSKSPPASTHASQTCAGTSFNNLSSTIHDPFHGLGLQPQAVQF